MVAVHLAAETYKAVTSSLSFGHSSNPKDPYGQNCIAVRLPTHCGPCVLVFGKDGHELKVRAADQPIFDTAAQITNAPLGGIGLAYVPDRWRIGPWSIFHGAPP